jgi:hypothetical protein
MPLIGRVNLDLAIDDLVDVANDDVRGVYLAGLKNIVQDTPADSGRARNNWFLSVGAPSNKITTSSSVGGVGSLSQASKMPKDVLNNTIFFTNNLPYIGVLEYGGFPSPVEKGSYIKRSKSFEILSINGFSKQAPNGWVRKTVIQMQNKIRSL